MPSGKFLVPSGLNVVFGYRLGSGGRRRVPVFSVTNVLLGATSLHSSTNSREHNSPSEATCSITLILLNGSTQRYATFFVNCSLDESNSHEHILPIFESHNHVSQDDHFHKDGFCDCNSQGPWKPLFKPSQELHDDLPDPESLHDLANSLHDTNHEHLHSLPDDLHPFPEDSSRHVERQAKKQNHMIHLHLIPHIYVPVVHSVSYPNHENNPNDHRNDLNTNPELHSNALTDSALLHHGVEEPNYLAEHDSNQALQHSVEHETFYSQEHHIAYPSQENYFTGSSDTAHHNLLSPENNHELGELTSSGYGDHGLESASHEHQYQVQEEHRDPEYGNFATGSSANSQVLAMNLNTVGRTKQVFSERSKYGKRYFDFPVNMRRLRYMSPPPLGQKDTWLPNFHRSSVDFKTNMFPMKPTVDIKHTLITNTPFVDLKSTTFYPVKPTLDLAPSIKTKTVYEFKKNFKPLQNRNYPKNPIVVYPTNTKRVDKQKPTSKST